MEAHSINYNSNHVVFVRLPRTYTDGFVTRELQPVINFGDRQTDAMKFRDMVITERFSEKLLVKQAETYKHEDKYYLTYNVMGEQIIQKQEQL